MAEVTAVDDTLTIVALAEVTVVAERIVEESVVRELGVEVGEGMGVLVLPEELFFDANAKLVLAELIKMLVVDTEEVDVVRVAVWDTVDDVDNVKLLVNDAVDKVSSDVLLIGAVEFIELAETWVGDDAVGNAVVFSDEADGLKLTDNDVLGTTVVI